MTNTRSDPLISSRRARLSASRYVITAISGLLEDVGEQLGQRRLRRGLGERHRLVDQVVDVLLDLADVVLDEPPGLQSALAEQHDRIAELLLLDPVLGAIHRRGGGGAGG